jgi:hypothetical protein
MACIGSGYRVLAEWPWHHAADGAGFQARQVGQRVHHAQEQLGTHALRGIDRTTEVSTLAPAQEAAALAVD